MGATQKFDMVDREWVEPAEFYRRRQARLTAEGVGERGTPSNPDRSFTIISDIAPYQSIITGEEIAGRVAHKNHLIEHDVEEMGDYSVDDMIQKHDPYDEKHGDNGMKYAINDAIDMCDAGKAAEAQEYFPEELMALPDNDDDHNNSG